MTSSQKNKLLLLAISIVYILHLCNGTDSLAKEKKSRQETIQPPTQNILLIGWDGTQRKHLLELLQAGKLPNLKKLIDKGNFINIHISSGETDTKAGWAKILTGYGPEITGVYNNFTYQPIPKGYTIFERLEEHFDNIETIFLAGKQRNLGSRGPHDVCFGCPSGNESFLGWLRLYFTREVRHYAGEPYFITKSQVDVFRNRLGPAENVGLETISYIEEFKGKRFFMFSHFREPDKIGHQYGENSAEYSKSLVKNDEWLGKIIQKLKETTIYQNTSIYLATDHGFCEGEKNHFTQCGAETADTFLITNDDRIKAKNGEIKDIAATILAAYNIPWERLSPPLGGVPLFNDGEMLNNHVVKLGYFHGGRVNMIYRAYINKFFDREGIDVALYTKDLREPDLYKLSSDFAKAQKMLKRVEFSGKISGIEIIEKIVAGELDGGTVGESSFAYCASQGMPIVAAAMLGHDVAESPGKGIVLRKGLVINSPEDFKGKTLISRRAGPGDPIFLREFLKSIGLAHEKSIKIIDGVFEDEAISLLQQGKIDGGLYHLRAMIPIIEGGVGYLYRSMTWMNPELSHALLVFRKDFLKKNPEQVQKIVNAYIKRVEYERNLPENQINKSRDKGLMMKLYFKGMSIPQYDMPPRVRLDLLNQMQELLLGYGKIKEKTDLKDFIDNSFVDQAYRKIKVTRNNNE